MRRALGPWGDGGDSTGHELCWHHPGLWSLLPELLKPSIAVPAWPQFMRGCIQYRQSLDEQAQGAPSYVFISAWGSSGTYK